MTKRILSVDVSYRKDETCYSVFRKPNRLEQLLRRMRLSRAIWEYKLLDQFTEANKLQGMKFGQAFFDEYTPEALPNAEATPSADGTAAISTQPEPVESEQTPLDLATHFANSIGSPWGEGATYERGRIQRAEAEGLYNHSHLDDDSKRNFIKDVSGAIDSYASKKVESALEAVYDRAVYNKHDFGEEGTFVRLQYLRNFIDNEERRR